VHPAVGDADDNALADSFKTEVITDRVWRTYSHLELATVEWVGWFKNTRLRESLGDTPPVEFEALQAPSRDPRGPIPGNRPAAAPPPKAAESPPTARIQPVALTGAQNGPDPRRPVGPAGADASLSSPSPPRNPHITRSP